MVFEKLKEILAEQLDVDADSITKDSMLIEDLGADSLDAIDIVMSVEDEFKIVGSAEIDLDNLEGEIVGRIDDPEVAKEIFNNRLQDLSIYSGDVLDSGIYGESTDGKIL